MEEINLSEIFNLVWKRKVQILVIILIFIIVGCVYTLKFVTPKYSSTITMVLVSNNQEDDVNGAITSSDITLNSKLVSTYKNLIKSKTVLKDVIDNLNLDIEIDSLKNNIAVNAVTNTELIEITVTTKESKLSADIANEIAKVFPEKIREMYNIDNIQLMSEAEVNDEPSNINHKKDILLFGVIGIVASAFYVIIMNLMDTTVKGTETIEKEFNLPVLASIPIYDTNSKKGGKK